MDYGYLLNRGEGDLYLYSYINGSIVKRHINGDDRDRAECVAEGAERFFYLTMRGDEPIIIYRKAGGDSTVMLAGGESRTLNRGDGRVGAFLSCIIRDRTMRFIYLDGNRLFTGGNSAETIMLDEIRRGCIYRLIPVVNGGYALLYIINSPDTMLGYREITAGEVGKLRRIYTTGFDIGDSSVCADENNLYIAFVSMSRFAVRVMYTRRCKDGFSTPKNLWEGSRCGKVCIAVDGCDVFVWWEANGVIFESSSDNGGESFSQCVRRGRAPVYSKALHLSEGSYGISEVMVSERGEIFAPEQVKELIYNRRRVMSKPHSTAKNVHGESALITHLKTELERKQQEIERLTHTLRSKNEEAGKLESILRERCRELKGELDNIKKVNESNEHKNN